MPFFVVKLIRRVLIKTTFGSHTHACGTGSSGHSDE